MFAVILLELSVPENSGRKCLFITVHCVCIFLIVPSRVRGQGLREL
jgi:hypothetical protein